MATKTKKNQRRIELDLGTERVPDILRDMKFGRMCSTIKATFVGLAAGTFPSPTHDPMEPEELGFPSEADAQASQDARSTPSRVRIQKTTMSIRWRISYRNLRVLPMG